MLDTHLHRQPRCLSAWLGFYLCSEPETEKNNCKECRKAKAKRSEHLGFISSRKDGSILSWDPQSTPLKPSLHPAPCPLPAVRGASAFSLPPRALFSLPPRYHWGKQIN